MDEEQARGKCRKERTGGMRESGREDKILEESRKGRERKMWNGRNGGYVSGI